MCEYTNTGYAFQPPTLVCRPRSTKRGRRPHRPLSPASVAATCPQPAALSSASCSSHLRGGEPLECHHGRVLPLCSRSLLAPAAACGLAQITFRSASLPRPPFLRTSRRRRRRAVAFASAGWPPIARGRFRIRWPAADGVRSLSHPPAGRRWSLSHPPAGLSHLPLDVLYRCRGSAAAPVITGTAAGCVGSGLPPAPP